MRTPINEGILQSDLDCAGFDLLNFSETPTGGSGWDENTVTAEDIGLVGDGVTDNTTALQTWFTSLEATQVNTTLLVPDGVYIFSGALQDASRQNAQLILPLPSAGAQGWTLTIKGYHALSPQPTPAPYGPTPICKGPIFKSTLATGGGTEPSFIGGMGPHGDFGDQSGLHLRLANMIFQTVSNPLITCLNFRNMSWVDMEGDIIIVAGGNVDAPSIVQPTTTTSYGLILPNYNIGVLETLESVHIFGFYTGLRAAELTLIEAVGIYFCYYAIEFPFAYHPTLIERYLDYWCPYGIRMTQTNYFLIQQMDIERAGDAVWYSRVYDVVDASNYGIGEITWWTVKTGIGALNQFDVSGGSGIKKRRLGSGNFA